MTVTTSSGEDGGRMLSIREVAEMLKVSPMTIYRLAHSDELEAVRVGRAFQIPEEALRRYLDQRE